MPISTQLSKPIKQIVKMVDDGYLIKPRLQRKAIWDKEKARNYIKHLLMFECSPQQILINHTRSDGKDVLQLVDGGNRVGTLICFYKQPFVLFDDEFQSMINNLPIVSNTLRESYRQVYALFSDSGNNMDVNTCLMRNNYLDTLEDHIYNVSQQVQQDNEKLPYLQYLRNTQKQIIDILNTMSKDETRMLDNIMNNNILRNLKTIEGNLFENIQININQYEGLDQAAMVRLFNDVNIPATPLSTMDSLNAVLSSPLHHVKRNYIKNMILMTSKKSKTNVPIDKFIDFVNSYYDKKEKVKPKVNDNDNKYDYHIYSNIGWQIAKISDDFTEMSVFEILMGITNYFVAVQNDYSFIKMEADMTNGTNKVPFTFTVYDYIYNDGNNYKNDDVIQFTTSFANNISEYFSRLITVMDFIHESLKPFHDAGPSRLTSNNIPLSHSQVTLLCSYLWNKELTADIGRYVGKMVLFSYLLDQSRKGYAKEVFWHTESYDNYIEYDVLSLLKKNKKAMIMASISSAYLQVFDNQGNTTMIDTTYINTKLSDLLKLLAKHMPCYCSGENGKERSLIQNKLLTTILNIYTYNQVSSSLLGHADLDYDYIIPKNSNYDDTEVIIGRLGNVALVNRKLVDKSRRVSLYKCRTFKTVGTSDRSTLAKYFEYPKEQEINKIMPGSNVNTQLYNEFCADREDRIINKVIEWLTTAATPDTTTDE